MRMVANVDAWYTYIPRNVPFKRRIQTMFARQSDWKVSL